MPKINAHIAHFSTGEFSAAGLARIDIENTRLAAETQENILPFVIGKGQCRPGTTYIDSTDGNTQARLIQFVRSIDETAVLVFTNGKMRVIVDDEYVTRNAVVSTITSGDFSSGTGWTLTTSSGANAAISGGVLTMDADARGSEASAENAVTTSNDNALHAVNIEITRGPVLFQIGSTSGGRDLLSQTLLGAGSHSLSFTPTGPNYFVQFIQREQRDCIIDSIQVASAGVMELTAPWTTAQLRTIRFDQSADVVYLANPNWAPRKIERRSNTSWSIVEYQPNDGPFRPSPSVNVGLTPAATFGNTTIAADKDVFSSSMVGGLIRLFHPKFDADFQLAAQGEYTDVWTVRGVKGSTINDREFTYATTGTWVGTLNIEKSITGIDGDFADYDTTGAAGTSSFTGNVSNTHVGDAQENNIDGFVRIGFTSYTSGVATVSPVYAGFSGYGVGRITAFTDAQNIDVEVLEDFNALEETRSWEIGAWSSAFEYPSAVAFFDGRLWWGGNDDFWATASDAFETLDDLEEGDAATIQRAVATGGQVSKVNWFLPLQRLIIGTTGAEVSVRSSSFDEPLTPSNITLKDASTLGSSSVSPVKIDSRGLFVHRSTNSVHAVLYSFDANDYTTDDLTEFNEDICAPGIVELAVMREPENLVWCVRADGQVAVLMYDWSETRQAQGWSRFVTDGEVESVCVLPGTEQDNVYFSIKRTINGSTVRYIEKLNKFSEAIGSTNHKMGDAGVFHAGATNNITATHLANETGLVAWGTQVHDGLRYAITGLSADTNGVIQLGETYSSVFVGKGYDCKYLSGKLAYAAQEGTALMQKKRVSQIGLLLQNTHRDAVSFGRSLDATDKRKMTRIRDGQAQAATAVYSTYDEPTMPFPGGWDTDSRVAIQVSAPFPATFLGLVIGVETNEK